MNYVYLFFVFYLASTVYCDASQDGSSSLVGLEFCNDGPHVWCQNFTTASQCHAVKHCIQTVWSMFETVGSDNECSNCVAKITQAKQMINSTTTKDVVEDIFDYICEANPLVRVLYKTCEKVIRKYVTNHIDELLDLLSSDVAPETICKLFGMCSGQKNDIFPLANENIEEEAVVQFENVLLHFPAQNQIFQFMLPSITDNRVDDDDDSIKVIEKELVVGSKKCTWGPSFWCENLKNSKECHTTSHCIENSWLKTTYPEDDDSVCQVCKDMVQQARDQLLSNETQEELKEVFEGSCKLIPIKEVRKECVALADEFVPELTEMLASEMNPTAVCSVAGLCNSARIDSLIASEKTDADFFRHDMCSNCMAAFATYQNYMRTVPKPETLYRVLHFCDDLSSYSDFFSRPFGSRFDDMYDTLQSQVKPFAKCHLSGKCAGKYRFHPSTSEIHFLNRVNEMVPSKDDDQLELYVCKKVFGHFKEIVTANTTEKELHQMLEGVCEQMGKFGDKCIEMVDDSFQIYFEFVTEELDPTKICLSLAVCPLNAPGLFTSDRVNEHDVPAMSNDVEFTPPPMKVTNAECDICTMVVGVVEKIMENQEYSNDIEKAVHEVCNYVPASDSKACTKFVHTYVDTLIKLLNSRVDPRVICTFMKLCLEVSAPVVQKNNELCQVCQHVLHYIQTVLDDPTDEDEVVKELSKVCALVPRAVRDQCNQFVHQYSNLIINILAQEIDPSLVCPLLKLCPGSIEGPQRCDQCRVLMGNFMVSVGDNRAMRNVESKMEQLMSLSGDRNQNLVAAELKVSHRDDIVDMVSAEFEADESCVFMKFCDAEDIEIRSPTDGNFETNDINGKPSCELCEMLTGVYENELTSNKTEQELEEMLNKFCRKMRRPEMQADCSKLVDKYLPQFLNMLKNGVSPKELCTAVKLCSLRWLTSPNKCTECEIVVAAVESLFLDKWEKIVEETLEICYNFLGKAHEYCSYFSMTGLLGVIERMTFEIPPWFVCRKFKECPYPHMLDGPVCSSTESQCASVKNAFQCGKLKFCKNTVWKNSKPPSQ